MPAEINIFIDNGAGHIKFLMPDMLDAFDEEGNAIKRDVNVEDVLFVYELLVEGIKANEHTLGWGEAPRAGGAPPAKRQEVPAPDGVPVPEHCGQPCEFKPAFVNPKTQKPVSAKFQCRNANCPSKAQTGGYAWSVFLDRWMKEQAEG